MQYACFARLAHVVLARSRACRSEFPYRLLVYRSRLYFKASLPVNSLRKCVVTLVLVASCSSSPLQLDNDSLSSILSVTNVQKSTTSAADGRISGMVIASTVINAGFITVDVPFLMRWSLLRDGSVFASTTQQMAAGLSPGDSRDVTLTLVFDPIESVSGLRDAVTFDILPRQS